MNHNTNENNFLPKRLLFLEAEPKFKEYLASIQGKNVGEIMKKLADKIMTDAQGNDLDEKTKSRLNEAKNMIADMYAQYEQEVESLKDETSSAKRRLATELNQYLKGKTIESPLELLFIIENAAIMARAQRRTGEFEYVLVRKEPDGKEKDDKGKGDRARNFEVKGDKDAYEIIKNAAQAKWATDLENKNVRAMLRVPQGRDYILKNRKEAFDRWLWEHIADQSSGFLGFRSSITVDEAENNIVPKIKAKIALYNEPDFQQKMMDLGVLVDDESDVDIKALRTASQKAIWANFATRLEKSNVAWATLTVEQNAAESSPERPAQNNVNGLLNSIAVTRIHNEIIQGIEISKEIKIANPKICVIGKKVFIQGDGNVWKSASIDQLKKADEKNFNVADIFQDSSKDAYINALKESGRLNAEAMKDIEAILSKPEELVRRVGERLSIQRDLQAFDRQALMSWSVGTLPPREVQEQLTTAVDTEFKKMVEAYKLNFIDKTILDNAKKAKMDAINEAFRNMDMPNIIAGIDKECRELSEQADPPQTYTPYEKFKIAIYPNSIRLVPDNMNSIHNSLFHGATVDAIRDKITKAVEFENNPLTKIPLIGPLLTLFLKDADPGMMKAIAGIAAFFGLKTPPMGDKIKEEIEKRVSEQSRKISEHYETLYPAITYDQLKTECGSESGIRSRKQGVKSVMLNEDSRRFTGVLRIPAEKTLRSVQHINARMLDISSGDTLSDKITKVKTETAEQRENIYAASDKDLLVYCENVVFKQYSNLPVGMKVVDGGFEGETPIPSSAPVSEEAPKESVK